MTFAGLVDSFTDLINGLVGLLVGVAMIIFFIGVIKYIYRAPNPKAQRYGRDMIVWGLLAIFVMVSVWGILRLARESFFPVF